MATTAEESLGRFERAAQTWIEALDSYSSDQFISKPSEEDWSIGQVYSHLLRSANFFQLANTDRCTNGTAEKSDEEKNETGTSIFQQGAFPNRQIKVPASPQYTPPQPESIDGIRAELAELVTRMRRTAPVVTGADPACKTPHPFFGPLNAPEWYQLVGMHFEHHLHQKGRLDAWLGKEG